MQILVSDSKLVVNPIVQKGEATLLSDLLYRKIIMIIKAGNTTSSNMWGWWSDLKNAGVPTLHGYIRVGVFQRYNKLLRNASEMPKETWSCLGKTKKKQGELRVGFIPKLQEIVN